MASTSSGDDDSLGLNDSVSAGGEVSSESHPFSESDSPGQGIDETDTSSGGETESGGSEPSHNTSSSGGSGDPSSSGGGGASSSSGEGAGSDPGSGGPTGSGHLDTLPGSSDDEGSFKSAGSDSASKYKLKRMRRKLRAAEARAKEAEELAAIETARVNSMLTRTQELENALGRDQQLHPVAASLLKHAPDSLPAEKIAMHTARTSPKPATFGGNSGTDIRQWFLHVQQYVFSVFWLASQLVPGAVALLTGDAALWWALEQGELRQRGLNPQDWWVFADALFTRWHYINSEATAMTKLKSFSQGNRPIEVYLREFSSLASQVSDYSDKQKCFDFLYGCSPEWRDKLNVNPLNPTQTWTKFSELSAYVIAVAATSSRRPRTGIVHDAAQASLHNTQGGGINKKTKGAAGFLAAAQRGAALGGSGRGAGGSGGAGTSGSGGAGPSNAAAGGGGTPEQKPYENAKKQRFYRTRAVREFCMSRKLCLCCYEDTHIMRDCINPPKRGNPPGFSG